MHAHSRYRYTVLTCLNAPRPAQEDPAFLAANNGDRPESLKAQHQADHPGSEADGGLNLMRDMDPLAVLALVKEYVIARSAKLSSRHYLDAQRVANRVWSKHFRHKVEMRGKVSRRHHSLIILPWSGCSIYTGCSGALKRPAVQACRMMTVQRMPTCYWSGLAPLITLPLLDCCCR